MTQTPGAHVVAELESTPYAHVRGIARGGHAEVHIVEHRELGGRSVMKLLHAKEPAVARELTRRLRTEGRVLRALSHPNIVEVLDFGFTKSDRAYLVTELLEGRTIREEVAVRGPLPIEEALDITAQILRGLACAHAAGLVHRDLKPENLIYQEAGPAGRRVVKILDFGIAKLVGAEVKQKVGDVLPTAQDTMLGTPNYASPEQIRCAPLDARADLYATGGVLYFMLTTAHPFAAQDVAGILQAHLVGPRPRPSSRRSAVPATIDDLIARAMAVEPDGRFRTAQLMLEEVERLLAGPLDEPPKTEPLRETIKIVLSRRAPGVDPLAAIAAELARTEEASVTPAPRTVPIAPEAVAPTAPAVVRPMPPAKPRPRAATEKMSLSPDLEPIPEPPATKRAPGVEALPSAPARRTPPGPSAAPPKPPSRIPRPYRIAIWVLSVVIAALALRLLERWARGAEPDRSSAPGGRSSRAAV